MDLYYKFPNEWGNLPTEDEGIGGNPSPPGEAQLLLSDELRVLYLLG